jgi:RES domain-containing protein
MRLHPQRDEFLTRVLDLPPSWITPFNALLFRFIDPQFSAGEDIISGEGGHWASGRWNQKGAMRVAYTATEPEAALAECLAHARYYNLPLNTALPRVLVSLLLSATHVLDLRDATLRRVLHISRDEIIATDWRRHLSELVL